MSSLRGPIVDSDLTMLLHKLPSRALVVAMYLAVLSVTACGGADVRKARHLSKGQTYLADGNYPKARVEFQNALQIAPNDAEVRFENGVVDEKLGKTREASQFYQGAIEVDPTHVGARTKLARLYVFAGAADRALDLILPAIPKHPDDSELLTVRAAALLQKKDTAAAKTDAQRAVQIDPTNEDAVAVLSGLYSSVGEPAQAKALLEKSVIAIPKTVDLRLVLVKLYLDDGQQDKAEGMLMDLVRLQPQEKAHRVRLAQFYARTNQPDAGERTLRQAIKDLPAEDDIKMALVEFVASRRGADAGERELKQMVAATPADSELQFDLAAFYERVQRPDDAEKIYRGVIAAEKFDAAGLSARDRLAAVRAQGNDVPGALKLIDEVLAKSPRDDDALLLRGNIALAKQDPRSAIADLRAVLRDQPNAIGVLRTLARAHMANGEPALAEEIIRNAADSNPKNPDMQLELARVLLDVGKAEQAKPVLADLLKAHPDNMEAQDLQFRVSMITKDYARAKECAENIVAARPKSAIGYRYEGEVAEADHRTDDAVRAYAAAVDIQPEVPESLQAEVRVLLNAKRGEEALRRLDDLSKRFPESPMGPDAKGEVLLRLGKNAEAQESFRAAIARAPKWWIGYRDLAGAQLAANQVDTAVQTMRNGKSLVAQPDALATELATLWQRVGKPDAAIAEYEEMLGRHPDSEVAANNLAMLLANSRTDQASLDRAKSLTARFAQSSNPSFLDTYGWVLYKHGEAAASVPVLERVVAKVPLEPVPHYHLGMAQSQLGSSDEARNNLSLAVSSSSNFQGREEAKAALDKLAKLPSAGASPKT